MSLPTIGVIGAGTMGRGIVQVAASFGHPVLLYDIRPQALEEAQAYLERMLHRLVEKGQLAPGQEVETLRRITFLTETLEPFRSCSLLIEAIVEDLSAKQTLFAQLERWVTTEAILATNTSSLSVTAIAAACHHPERVLGLHFFNPAPLMPLVEVVPGLATAPEIVARACTLMENWGKTTVIARDTPGFIVNRIARPFYGEALRLLEEGIADVPTIDWALCTLGGFRMGPFALMDLIGNDINYKVTETLWKAFFYEPRYRPSFIQQRLVEAGRLGRKTGIGFYDYREGTQNPAPTLDAKLGQQIFERVLAMLINEAADAVFWRIASPTDIDRAMTLGVNYPKGLLHWADELGIETVLHWMETLYATYREDRYRPSPLWRQMQQQGRRFFE
jgi:3-hydroxybutyryl-CoA dehydrogenase